MMYPPNAIFCWLPGGYMCVPVCFNGEDKALGQLLNLSELQLPSMKMKMISVPNAIKIKC